MRSLGREIFPVSEGSCSFLKYLFDITGSKMHIFASNPHKYKGRSFSIFHRWFMPIVIRQQYKKGDT